MPTCSEHYRWTRKQSRMHSAHFFSVIILNNLLVYFTLSLLCARAALMPSFNTENMGFVMKTCVFVCYITCLLLQLALIIQNVSTKQKKIIFGALLSADNFSFKWQKEQVQSVNTIIWEFLRWVCLTCCKQVNFFPLVLYFSQSTVSVQWRFTVIIQSSYFCEYANIFVIYSGILG